jgi:cellulose synthase (UDP-forming)
VLLAAQGREGVFLPEIIATGDGPETFETYLAQQFAWAFSMFQVLFRYTPRLVREYTARRALQFLFVQTWYLLWSLSMLALFFAPLAALVLDVPISHVGLGWFYLHSIPLGVTAAATWHWSRRWFQPAGVSLSWRGIVLHIARWVVVLSALVQVILRVQKPYMITVKGMSGRGLSPYSLRPLVPYYALSVLALAACGYYLTFHGHSGNQGYLYFAVLGATLFAVMIAVVVKQEIRSRRRGGASSIAAARSCSGALASTAILALAIGATGLVCATRVIDAFTA